jgi:heme/copper-type cytochrome/quinol oxidase subunit 3
MRLLRKFRVRAGDACELGAFVLAAVVVWHFADVWWALVPVAVYLFLLSLALDGGRK